MATPVQPDSNTGLWAGGLLLGSGALLAFLMLWESSGSTILTVYPDRLAGGLPTVCDGITRNVTRTPIVVGETWSPEKCERETREAVVRVQLQLVKCFRVEPPQSVFDAASSHAWNFGAAATCNSAAMKAWNRGDYVTGCRRLHTSDGGRPVWSYVKTGRKLPNGQPEYRFVRGLQDRRQDEAQLCMSGAA